jgi:CMP-2-keto-3-deoxyoctulosonic acid synthetase
MRLWALVSLAPHTYLMAICAMLDRRLADGRPVPKPLREVAGVPLIVRVIRADVAGDE